MILLLVIITYIRDCKEIGKDDLAVPLSERLFAYFVYIFLPILLCVLYRVL
jgi:hypothetical protein